MSSSSETEPVIRCPHCLEPLRLIEVVPEYDDTKSIYTCDNEDGCSVTFVYIFT